MRDSLCSRRPASSGGSLPGLRLEPELDRRRAVSLEPVVELRKSMLPLHDPLVAELSLLVHELVQLPGLVDVLGDVGRERRGPRSLYWGAHREPPPLSRSGGSRGS